MALKAVVYSVGSKVVTMGFHSVERKETNLAENLVA
jgi:hypothetical protein